MYFKCDQCQISSGPCQINRQLYAAIYKEKLWKMNYIKTMKYGYKWYHLKDPYIDLAQFLNYTILFDSLGASKENQSQL